MKGEVTSVESYNVVFDDVVVACCVVETWFVLTSIEKLQKKRATVNTFACKRLLKNMATVRGNNWVLTGVLTSLVKTTLSIR